MLRGFLKTTASYAQLTRSRVSPARFNESRKSGSAEEGTRRCVTDGFLIDQRIHLQH